MRLINIIRVVAMIFIVAILISFTEDTRKYHVLAVKNVADLHSLFKYSGERSRFVSAHRGGTLPGFPENCIATFENTLKHTFAILEIDPRYTRDSLMVLHHDPVLGRTADGEGTLINYTLKELQKLKLKDLDGKITDYSMPSFDEALEWAKGKTILVIDQKDISARERLKKVEEHKCIQNVVLIMYSFEDAKQCYKLNRDIMMEVMIPSVEKVLEFDKTGVPWKNVVAFVRHQFPDNPELYRMIHERGALCMAGSSRNIDLKFLKGQTNDIKTLKDEYMTFFKKGIDIIETDLPSGVGPVIGEGIKASGSSGKLFRIKAL